MELTDFLLARIAEDEDVLTRCEATPHGVHGYDAIGNYSPYCPTCRQAVFGSRERGLAECAAKRAIVEGIRDATSGPVTEYYIGPMMTTDHVLRLLAQPYARHPDYCEEWTVRPSCSAPDPRR